MGSYIAGRHTRAIVYDKRTEDGMKPHAALTKSTMRYEDKQVLWAPRHQPKDGEQRGVVCCSEKGCTDTFDSIVEFPPQRQGLYTRLAFIRYTAIDTSATKELRSFASSLRWMSETDCKQSRLGTREGFHTTVIHRHGNANKAMGTPVKCASTVLEEFRRLLREI